MAEIPIERKEGIPWWVWALLGALLLALLFWLLADDDDGDVDVVGDADTPAVIGDMDDGDVVASEIDAADADGTAITDLSLLTSTSDGSLEGRSVALNGVVAGDVPEDAGFWIVGEGDSRLWVVLEEVRTPDTAIEGRVDVDKGDRLDIVGTIVNAKDGAPVGAAIPGPTAELPAGIHHFIHASRVTQSGS